MNLVEVYATVTDERGEPIGDLSAADFRVAEDGIPQMVSAFAAGEFPLSVAIGVDRSFSMASGKVDRLSAVKNAARTFVGALRAGDQVMVIAVGSETEVAAPLSADRAAALAAIDRIEPLVLLSDGVDRYSDTQPAALLDRARRSDVLAYPIAIGRTRAPIFAELAAATGGRSFFVKDPRELPAEMTAIARELHFQYLLGYAPARGGEPGWRSIDVTVNRPGVRVRARDGYFSR